MSLVPALSHVLRCDVCKEAQQQLAKIRAKGTKQDETQFLMHGVEKDASGRNHWGNFDHPWYHQYFDKYHVWVPTLSKDL